MALTALNDAGFQKRVVWLNAGWPAALLLGDWWTNRLGANPVEVLTRTSGVLALLFLTFTLAVSPLAKWLGWGWLVKHRRALGLASYFYALAHFLVYFAFDRGGSFAAVPGDVAKRPFILAGFLAFLLMIPLAATSTNGMIRRLGGPRWKRLHRLTYAIPVAAVVHYAMIVKSDLRWPVAFAAVTAALFLARWAGRVAHRAPADKE